MSVRLPIVPTVLVLIAVAIMVALGFWQLDRRDQKAALLVRYKAAAMADNVVRWPETPRQVDSRLYRRTRLNCEEVREISAQAGRNAQGQSGLAITAACDIGSQVPVTVVLGWSMAPQRPDWRGGMVSGMIAPGPRLVADPPLAGLAANARPDPADIPDNHLAYAVQWFFFAATALVVYALAVRKRLAGGGPDR